MSIRLVYHEVHGLGATSRFDEAIVAIAQGDNLRLACPYLTVTYLERITRLSDSWRLITDVQEWLSTLSRSQREIAFNFMSKHPKSIRHFYRVHAKVVIGTKAALLGSANLTDAGITERTEMSISIESEAEVRELARWFDELWDKAHELRLDEIPDYMSSLPERETAPSALNLKLFPSPITAYHPLVKLPELPPPVSPPQPLSPPLRPSPAPTPPSQFTRASRAGTQVEIIDAILGAYPYSSDRDGLSAKRQIELLRIAYNAKLVDGRNAFPAMHGGAESGDADQPWDGKDRTNRMKKRVSQRLATKVKVKGKNLYMLAKGVMPTELGVSQIFVDALAAHKVIPSYDVNEVSYVEMGQVQ